MRAQMAAATTALLLVGAGPASSEPTSPPSPPTAAAGDASFRAFFSGESDARRYADPVPASSSAPTQAQIMAARQAYVDSSICLPSSIAGLTFGNICAGPTACEETTFGGYLETPYLAAGIGRPDNCTTTPGNDPAAVINAAVYQAFREIPLPETTLQIQPPDGTTLVNLATNFFTTTEPFTTTVTVLGYTVDLDITPTSYTWDFGDGTTTTTTTPGAPYPDLDVTHTYTRTGTYPTQLTTTWSADFRIDNGPWQRVDGTVDMPSPTLDLQVREATPVLTG